VLFALGEHGDGDCVDRQSALLVSLGVLAQLLARADQVAERDVHQAGVQVDVCPLQPAQLARAGRR
jgi:hypothetical protein